MPSEHPRLSCLLARCTPMPLAGRYFSPPGDHVDTRFEDVDRARSPATHNRRHCIDAREAA